MQSRIRRVRLLVSGNERELLKCGWRLQEMSKSLTADMMASGNDDEIKAAVQQFLVEIERNREKMQRDQEDIDRLKARTRAALAQLEAT